MITKEPRYKRSNPILVLVYRKHAKDAADLLAKEVWDATAHRPYRHVGEVTESSRSLNWKLSGWRWECISPTRLAAWIPLIVLLAWSGLLLA